MLTGITAALRQGAKGATADNEPPPPRGQHPERRRSPFLPPCRLYGALLPRGRAAAGARGRAGRSRGTVRGTPGRAPRKPAPPPPRRGRGRAGSAPGRRAASSLPPPRGGGKDNEKETEKAPRAEGKPSPPAAFVPRPGAATRQRRGGGRPRAHALARGSEADERRYLVHAIPHGYAGRPSATGGTLGSRGLASSGRRGGAHGAAPASSGRARADC